MCNMLNEMGQWPNWTYIIFKDRNNRFCYSYSFNEPVINSLYRNSNNFYGYTLLVVISVDENNNNQILCFCDVNAFLTDRCISQIAAIKEIWQNTHIIYCSVHVGRNIKSDCNEVMFKLYLKNEIR